MPESTVEKFDATKAPKGFRTWKVKNHETGETLRVMVPADVDKPEDIKPYADAEFRRRNPGASSVKEIPGDYLNKASSFPQKVAGEAWNQTGGGFLEGLEKDPIGTLTNAASLVNFDPGLDPVPEGLNAPSVTAPNQMGLAEDIANRGPAAITAASLLGLAPAALRGTSLPARLSTGVSKARAAEGYSPFGRAAGGAVGALVGGETGKTLGLPGYAGVYPGYKLGGYVGGKIPPVISAFRQGFAENPYKSATVPNPTITPQRNWMTPEVEERLPMENFRTRLHGLEEATREEPNMEFSQLPPENKGVTGGKSTTTGDKPTIELPHLKDLAEKHNQSVNSLVKEFQDAGYEVKTVKKAKTRRR